MSNLVIAERHRVRKDFYGATSRNYWDSKREVLDTINNVLQKHNMRLGECSCPGDNGSTIIDILAEPNYKYLCSSCLKDHKNPVFDNFIQFSWYRMPSGKWEITTYIT